jgi:hypothetical protein
MEDAVSAWTVSLAVLAAMVISPAGAREAVFGPGTLHPIIPGHYAYYTNGFDSGVIVTPGGVVVVDALGEEATAKNERQQIALIIRQPVRYLISSSFHDNYTQGNSVYADVTRIGHENYRSDLLDLVKNLPPAEQQARLPLITYRDRVTIHPGGKEIQIRRPPTADRLRRGCRRRRSTTLAVEWWRSTGELAQTQHTSGAWMRCWR